MLVLVLGDSLPVMFVGWEGVGLCSYLLIGFWYSVNANADAGKKAFIVNRIGDFGFLLGMFLLFNYSGTLNFGELTEFAQGSGKAVLAQPFLLGAPVAFWAGLLLFIGATGKSAQIPLYVWLPDAMAGPTPVSALIHAATMVTAGVYMVARMHALYILSPAALAIVACVGAATALFAAIIGFAQNDFKKVLAYSTVSQLGFMFVGVGTANFEAGIFHLFTHAFFKAGLFLCAGSVMHAMSGSGDITIMGGLRKKIPWTHAVFLVCWLAISGFPLFSGFFSKDAIVAGAFETEAFGPGLPWLGPTLGVVLLAAAFGTAFYMSRLYFLVFSGTEPRTNDPHMREHIHESPGVMVIPLVILAVGALAGGIIGAPFTLFGHDLNLFGHELEPVLGREIEAPARIEAIFMVVSALIGLAGIGIAYLFYGGGYRKWAVKFGATFPGLVKLVQDKFRIDELYDRIFVRPLRSFAQWLYRIIDRWVIDRVLIEGTAWVVGLLGRLARSVQTGDGQRYMAVFAVGVAILVCSRTVPSLPSELKVHTNGLTIEVDARRGSHASSQPLEYTFDFGDGTAPASGPSPEAKHEYSQPGSYTINVTVKDPRYHRHDESHQTVEVR
jgi:NADH-quinone oxidoreductase subunit L